MRLLLGKKGFRQGPDDREWGPGSPLEALIEQRLRNGSQDLYEEARRDLDRFLLPRVLRSTGGNQLRAA
jgi:hypothetical protein